MKKSIMLMFIIILTFAFAGCEKLAETGSIEGRVIDKIDGSAIQNATVWTNPPTSRVLTDNDGRYYIDGVSPGDYTVYASASGYHTDSVAVHVVEGNRTRADFMLEPGP